MYQDFYIKKYSDTYAETLEAFGVASLLNEILTRTPERKDFSITIEDKGLFYLVRTSVPITEEEIERLPYFQILKFIKKDLNQQIPEGIFDYYDYPKNKAILNEYKERYSEIEKIKSPEEKKLAKRRFNEEKLSEFGSRVDMEFDVYREIKGNPYVSFVKMFQNIHQNKDSFQLLVREILENYRGDDVNQNRKDNSLNLVDANPTAQQLYNPNQGKGLNKGKANNASMSNLCNSWISETMKISGSLSFMIVQYIKVGSGYDLKIFVPAFHDISFSKAKTILLGFKKYIKATSPIKLDIINILGLTVEFIKQTPAYNKGKVKNTIKGFHSVYQKDLGQNKAVANIAFLNTPDFVEYSNKEEGHDWIEILETQRSLISNVEEGGSSMSALQDYRNFLGSTNENALSYFLRFSCWYSGYLMQQLTKGNKYVRTFKTETLIKFYNHMDKNLSQIINNNGFKAVATAVRKSTVSLQYTPKEQRQFEIRYGLAQQLQNKSKSKEDLATFIGEFVGTYNAETARNAEKNGGKAIRANVKDEELIEFYTLLDQNPPRLVGALLASFGFALSSKEKKEAAFEEAETTDVEESI